MVLTQPYSNLDHALKHGFRVQVSESLAYVLDNFPLLDSPKKIFDFLKRRITYKKDPKGVELFQTVETLLDNNYHGITGAGDCDCFSIAALSTLLANGFTDSGIVLAGRNPLVPVHIWVYTIADGIRYELDLTNPTFNTTRQYRYQQSIPYVLNKKEKNMLLQLAEGNPIPSTYIYFPNQGVKVREDYYDHTMSNGEFQSMLLSEGFDFEEIAELSSKRSERKAANKAQRQVAKDKRVERRITKQTAKPRNVKKVIKAQAKADTKVIKAQTRNVKQQGKANKRTDSGQARIIRANNPNRGEGFRSVVKSVLSPTPQPEAVEPEEFYQEEVLPQEYFSPEEEPQEVEYVEAEIPEEEEEFIDMAEGVSISKPLLYTGGFLLLASLAMGVRSEARNYKR